MKNLMKESVMFITGRRKNLELNGPKEKVQAYLNVLVASKDLYETLSDPRATLKEVNQLVNEKKRLAREYKQKTGVVWPL